MRRAPDEYRPLADYGLIGDCYSAALVSHDGSIDWLCTPRFDSPSLFARLLDARNGGYFAIHPVSEYHSHHEYAGYSGVLNTTFENADGAAVLTDFMPLGPGDEPWLWARPQALRRLVRTIEGVRGELELLIDFAPKPGYAIGEPTLTASGNRVSIRGPDASQFRLYSSVGLRVLGTIASCRIVVRKGERLALVLDLSGSQDQSDEYLLSGVISQLDRTLAFWTQWCGQCKYRGVYEDAVMRSAITLKLLTYSPTGGMVAAPTTSLPEQIGGERNWDYRYTWIRDASFGAYALLSAGHEEDAFSFFEWVSHVALQSRAGTLQIMYGLDGETDLPEITLSHLEGYRRSAPVRIGNAASTQFQLDVYGELLDCFHAYRRVGKIPAEHRDHVWPAFRQQVDYVVEHWREPDSGIWEVRTAPRHFVYSKVMAWTAVDRGIRGVEEMGFEADLARWRAARDAIRSDVLQNGYDSAIGAFTQSYGEPVLDAANLLLPLVGFIDANDDRMHSTIAATERDLLDRGLLYRYRGADDGLRGAETTFGVCTFWLVENLVLAGRVAEAQKLFEGMLARATPLGLYGEELEPSSGTHLGNFPQALTHIGLMNAAVRLGRALQK